MVAKYALIQDVDLNIISRSGRWYVEQEKLSLLYPQFQLVGSNNKISKCIGKLRTNFGNIYKIEVGNLDNYPYSVPTVHVDGIRSNPHYYGNGQICYMRDETWSPNQTTLSFVIGKTAIYLNKYDFFLRKGYWPGADAHRL